MSSRSAARAAIASALTDAALFAAVLEGTPRTLGGKSPVAVVRSQSAELIPQARRLATFVWGIYVTIYVAETPSTTPDQVEDTLDALVAAVLPLLDALVPESADTHIRIDVSAPPEGAPRHEIDGVIYRCERIPIAWDAEA